MHGMRSCEGSTKHSLGLMFLRPNIGPCPFEEGCRKPSFGAGTGVSALRASNPHACMLRLPYPAA